jgi:hypothetical protein
MITNNAEALEGLRNALAQLHDVNVYYHTDEYMKPDQVMPDYAWCASVALDWVRTALHYGEQAALTEGIAEAHEVPGASHECPGCLADFTTRENLEAHMATWGHEWIETRA